MKTCGCSPGNWCWTPFQNLFNDQLEWKCWSLDHEEFKSKCWSLVKTIWVELALCLANSVHHLKQIRVFTLTLGDEMKAWINCEKYFRQTIGTSSDARKLRWKSMSIWDQEFWWKWKKLLSKPNPTPILPDTRFPHNNQY